MANTELLAQVAKHKEIFFREATARYDLASKGTLRLVPGDKLLGTLRREFEKMGKEMYLGNLPDFDDVMKEIDKLEKSINQT